MKELKVAKTYQAGHPSIGKPTYFVEKIMRDLSDRFGVVTIPDLMDPYFDWKVYETAIAKSQTARPSFRWNDGEWVNMRIWSGNPYRSKPITFAQVQISVKRLTLIDYDVFVDGAHVEEDIFIQNDGLTMEGFKGWFPPNFEGKLLSWIDAKAVM